MTPTFHTILLDVQDRVATVTLNRPDSRNALNSLMCAELVQAMQWLAAEPTAVSYTHLTLPTILLV